MIAMRLIDADALIKRWNLREDGDDEICGIVLVDHFDRWREQRKPKKYREDCFWYDEDQDMSMRIPVCNYKIEPPDCYIKECPEHCKTYIKREKAMDILRKYVRSYKNEID